MTRIHRNYPEYKKLDLPAIEHDMLARWERDDTFRRSVEERPADKPFVFYEGPPSANGMPGIHHVMARAVKDLFCRYKTMKGYRVERKGGWDTHGLPVELQVEKMLGITREDIGKTISIAEYNRTCREEVMKYKDAWDDLTRKMGYWVDLDDPYITFENNYIESLWYLLKQLYDKGLLYKGYTIQPYSPAAGTGLSSHELNLPGTYRDVKDTTAVAMFRLTDPALLRGLVPALPEGDVHLLAWTTTPWTLPSNTALAVGERIRYSVVSTFNPYTALPNIVVLAKDLVGRYFKPEDAELPILDYAPGQKTLPYRIMGEVAGKELVGLHYDQLLPYAQPTDGDAFRVIPGDFVTTEEGTGIVHIAPSFGADDLRVARQHGIGSLTLVDREGKFVHEVTDFAGRFVKNYKDEPDYTPVDIDIVVKLKLENKAFRIEKYEHSYPHCWRTDKPIIYYPLNSWFIRSTAVKDRMVALNKTINWKPEFTGTGRFGNWLENLVDWNLSRSRFWGTPLPIWVSEGEDPENIGPGELRCIGSVAELREAVQASVQAGFMNEELPEDFDLHRPFVDDIILVSPTGKRMLREPDLIDVWFDSGAMPYAQWHYPFENQDKISLGEAFPADFIAEGVDQTRGWFFTLHAIAVMLFDSVAFKNVVSNGLVLDKSGNKMSKRLGNAVDPFTTIAEHGADALRWYMMSNSQPWDNLKFDMKGVEEVKRKFFGTLYNTYAFFALYANIDGFVLDEQDIIPVADRPEIDRWVISKLHALVSDVDGYYDDYEPTKATRAIQEFVDEHLSNWYVRLCRKRFWRGELTDDKKAAYETLFECLNVTAQLMSPVAPFFADWLYTNLTDNLRQQAKASSSPLRHQSVHLSYFTTPELDVIDEELNASMELAQIASSLVLSLRKKENIKVRQPLSRVIIPVLDPAVEARMRKVEDLIRSEVNVKTIEYLNDTEGLIKKRIKPDFKVLGPRLGPHMKYITQAFGNFIHEDIVAFERLGYHDFNIGGELIRITVDEAEISTEDIPGWLVASEGNLTVALDISISTELAYEGHARELVNRIQRLRKDSDFNVTDRIRVYLSPAPELEGAVVHFKDYICSETLAEGLEFRDKLPNGVPIEVNEIPVNITIETV